MVELKINDLRQAQSAFNAQKHKEYIQVSIDRVTVLVDSERPNKLFRVLKKRLEQSGLDGFVTVQDGNYTAFSICKEFENGERVNLFYVEITLKGDMFVRIDFNPNTLREYDAMGLWRQIITYIRLEKLEVHLSRLDLAFDIRNMPSIKNLKHVKGGVSENIVIDRSKELETIYFGKRSSNVQVRLYDKNKERLHRRKLTEQDLEQAPHFWRFEMQLRTKAINKDTVSEVIHRLGKFSIYDYEVLSSDPKFAYFYLHDESLIPVMYPDLSFNAIRQRKQRIRKRLEKIENDFSLKMTEALIEQMPKLAKELKQYTSQFLGFEED